MTELLLTTGGVIVLSLAVLVVLYAPSPRAVERLERLIWAWRRK